MDDRRRETGYYFSTKTAAAFFCGIVLAMFFRHIEAVIILAPIAALAGGMACCMKWYENELRKEEMLQSGIKEIDQMCGEEFKR